MVNLLAVKMIVLIVVTNCYIVDFQYALLVLSHQDSLFLFILCILMWYINALFLPYRGILMHINSLQHIVVLHFVQIQQHLLDHMVLVLFYWDPHGA